MDVTVVFFLCLPLLCASLGAKRILKLDRDHLKSDFLNIFGSWATIFSDAEMDFRYFAAHDYDNNKKLDGLELYTALGHDSRHDNESHVEDHSTPEDIERQVDDIFEEHDTNNDGFLNYKEFLSVQRTYPDLTEDKKGGDRKPPSRDL
ncbi:multiple coagulation factor deficiency protein 2 homolog isoform X1 [Argiope bruennichi]|uniref:multiple coagulation factor deficiency protein 2 homolog isoform X1 n=2 Tax=Argiope bruennichi TaxID=94029 RepID=UPI00249567F2|nr:multiple coagulation factor deficiency protein 2 homolog isoform X1 [Argiope bruennichi]XP_055940841.1 multiple coagulation factor deficiency protein 2 homolog isoform X1 [Argiope bruennichi]XP_055940851.1 multiple coagulation factor deficiency protein 2 homolog isoform X1 [Argiope bruennichi]